MFRENAVERDGVPSATDTRTGAGTPGLASVKTFARWVLAAIGWFVFFWAWVSVMRHTSPQTMVNAAILLAAGAGASEAISLVWIRHNLNIFRKKGPRESVPRVRYEFSRDFLGRKLVGDWRSLAEEALIFVDFDEERKTFAPEKLASPSRSRVVPIRPRPDEGAVQG